MTGWVSALIVPIIAGYYFISKCKFFAYETARTEGSKLYLKSFFAGMFFVAFAFILLNNTCTCLTEKVFIMLNINEGALQSTLHVTRDQLFIIICTIGIGVLLTHLINLPIWLSTKARQTIKVKRDQYQNNRIALQAELIEIEEEIQESKNALIRKKLPYKLYEKIRDYVAGNSFFDDILSQDTIHEKTPKELQERSYEYEKLKSMLKKFKKNHRQVKILDNLYTKALLWLQNEIEILKLERQLQQGIRRGVNEYVLLKILNNNNLELMLQQSLLKGKLIFITLVNRKVYIGYNLCTHDLRSVYKDARIMPVYSGYRDEQTLQFRITNDYTKLYYSSLYAEKNGTNVNNYELVFRFEEIHSIHYVNIDELEKAVEQYGQNARENKKRSNAKRITKAAAVSG